MQVSKSACRKFPLASNPQQTSQVANCLIRRRHPYTYTSLRWRRNLNAKRTNYYCISYKTEHDNMGHCEYIFSKLDKPTTRVYLSVIYIYIYIQFDRRF